ncbi:MAG: dTDP-glucose 4,6-dehydratase [Rhizobiales bacterium 62-17]|nr:PhoX family phosphatase [Hyphomicrobiales bacterium]OJY05753.1 MAG: dTDP-glucose 4,6-dehydratase [Rhizobiales bacterium 62-17]
MSQSKSLLSSTARLRESEDIGSNASENPTIGDMIAARLNRRDLMRGALAVGAVSATLRIPAFAQAPAPTAKSAFNFVEIEAGSDEKHHVAQGYDADILIRWGDPVLPGAPAFDPTKQTAAGQKLQFGYNNDYVGFLPMPGAADPSSHGLLVVNHEYTNEELMFPGIGGRQELKQANFANMTKDLVDIEMAAHGGSVLEIKRENGKWQIVPGSKYARRITAETPIALSGPAAGDARLKTSADPDGKTVHGMVNNCSGGVTPWGTWLTCEENFNGYFWGAADGHPDEKVLKRYGAPANQYAWGKYYDRFDIAKERNEINRFGWIVEIDPFDPTSTPKKRTALGRVKHEAAAGITARDGRYVVYTGDDERFDYVYKFVTEGRVDSQNRAANMDLLDRGTLYVAKYNADGSGEWLPLVHGQGKLTAENGFASQADVLIHLRLAGDAVGATKMDRPEDVEANPKTGKVYVMLTNNTRRTDAQIDAANPRANNRFGHIVEMTPADGDHAATAFRWDILVKAGDHTVATTNASFNPATTKNGWFGMPDNLAVDNQGRVWIATDGNSPAKTGRADGLWAIETEGPLRGTSKHFFRVPAGAEMCGPFFTPNDETLFLAVQHPGEADEDDPKAPPATFEQPATRWPDFKDGVPPRPSLVVVTKTGGGKIAV